MPPILPTITTLPTLDTTSRAAILDTLFEPCTQLHTLSVALLRESTFPSYDALIAAVGDQLTSLFQSKLASDQEWLDAILSAHPRLGEKRVESEQSRAEQAKLGGGGEEEAEKLASLNGEYEAVFPGLRYVYGLSPFSCFSWLLFRRTFKLATLTAPFSAFL